MSTSPAGRRHLTLAVVLLGVLVVPMSISGAAVALPAIGTDLDASGASLQWVVNAYNLTFASLTLVFGSLADTFGRRRVFALGAALFGAGSALGAVANTIWLLDLSRAVAGAGAAGVLAAGGAILAVTFQGPARTRAFAALGTAAGIGLALGPTASGVLVGALGWRSMFAACTAVLAVALLGTAVIPESRAPERAAIDRAGVATFIGGLALLTLAVVQGPESGWGSPAVLALFAGAAALLAAFVAVELRSAAPVLDLGLVRDRRFLALCLTPVATSFGFVTLLTFLPTYLVGVNEWSAARAGATMLLLTAPVLVAPPIAGWMFNRGVPGRTLIGAGLLMFAGGNAWLTVVHPGAGAATLMGPLLLLGLGAGLSFGVNDGMALSMVEPARAGMAAGFLNTMRIGSEAIVIAVFLSAFTSLLRGRVGSADLAGRVAAGDLGGADHARLAAQFTDVLHIMLWALAAICAVAAVLVHAMLAPRDSGRARTPAEPEPAKAL
ncbi:MFS transporter [Spirillospora sp. CA-294931]|uniref:MFS transporter n=1 Tax=Spirillospora sp. CA-294931 TaxID=3240042 RepID=UPI003D8EF12D